MNGIKKYLKSPKLAKEMRGELKKLCKELKSNKRVREKTLESYVWSIYFLGRFLADKQYKSYKEARKEDILQYLNAPYPQMRHSKEEKDSAKRKRLEGLLKRGKSEGTINLIKNHIRIFYRWLLTGTFKGGYPPVVDWIEVKAPNTTAIAPEDCITPSEFARMLDACKRQRDRAILQLFWESGARVGEILNLKIKDVHFGKDSVYIDIRESKTRAGIRKVYLYDSISDLKAWLNMHPVKNNPDAPLLISYRNNEPLKAMGVRFFLLRIAKTAGIEKHIFCHLFRSSRCHIDSKNGLPLPLALRKFGWSGASGGQMYSRYARVSDSDVADWDMRVRGIKNGEEKDPMQAKKCPRCGGFSAWNDQICRTCGQLLDSELATKVEATTTLASEIANILREEERKKNEVLERKLEEMQRELETLKRR
jgi:site-specific recombinase XerD